MSEHLSLADGGFDRAVKGSSANPLLARRRGTACQVLGFTYTKKKKEKKKGKHDSREAKRSSLLRVFVQVCASMRRSASVRSALLRVELEAQLRGREHCSI